MRRWYVVHSQPRAEAQAECHLERQGFAVYLPRYLKRRRHARKAEVVAAPLFPRYLFVAMDLTVERWRAVHSTVGVQHLICAGEKPIPVPDGIIGELRARENESGLVQTVVASALRPGERLQLVAGAFNGYEALFQCISDKERIIVLLDLLGRPVRTAVPLDAVANSLA